MLSACLGATFYLSAADHIDSPAVTGSGSEVTDYYAFERPGNSNNIVLVLSVQGLLPTAETSSASFDEEVMLEIAATSDCE